MVPDVGRFDDIKAAARLKDIKVAKRLFRNSVRRSSIPAVQAYAMMEENDDLELPAAFQALIETVARHEKLPCPIAVRRALEKYLRTAQRQCAHHLGVQPSSTPTQLGLAMLSSKVVHTLHLDEQSCVGASTC